MKFLKCWLIFFTLTVAKLGAQSKMVDSLTAKLDNVEGIQRIELLNRLTFEHLSKDNAKAMEYCSQAISLADKLDYQKGLGKAYTYRGVYEYLSGEFSDGRENLRKGLNLATKVKDKENQGYSLLQLGNSFMNQGQMDSALLYYNESYVILKDSTNALTLSKLYKRISTLYGLRSNLDLEKKYLIRSMRIREKLGDRILVTDGLILLAGLNIREDNIAAANHNLDSANKLLIANPSDKENLNDWRHQKGLILLRENRYQEALVLFDSAISYYSSRSLLLKYVVLQTDLGKIFNDWGEYGTALKCFEDGLKIAESKGYDIEIADLDLQIGWAYFHLGELKQATELIDRGLKLAEQYNIPGSISDALILRGITFAESNDFINAKRCFDKALAIRKQLKDRAKTSQAYENLGYLELKRGNYNSSIGYYGKSLPLADSVNYKLGKIWSLYGLGRAYSKLGKSAKAIEYLNQSEDIAIKSNAKEALRYIYREKKEFFQTRKDFKQALYYSELTLALKDSLHQTSVGRRFGGLQRYQEIRQKELEIISLNQEKELAKEQLLLQEQKLNQQYYLILLSAALIIAFGALAFVYARFYFRVKRLNLAVNQQKEELQTQSSYIHRLNKDLEGLVTEKTIELQKANQELVKQNDELLQFSYSVSHNLRGPVARMLGITNIYHHSKDKAEHDLMIDYVRRASQDLDDILRDLSKIIDVRNDLHSSKEWVDLEQEWLRICSLLKDVINEQFQISYSFEQAPKIFTIKAIVQSVFYNLLSNSIKYRSDNRTLIVHANIRLENGNGYIEITDNGVGIDVDKFKDSLFKIFKRFHTHVEGRGLGLYLIKSQVESLNGHLKVDSIVDQQTTFTVMIPDVLKN